MYLRKPVRFSYLLYYEMLILFLNIILSKIFPMPKAVDLIFIYTQVPSQTLF